jgi:hypothetical protein
MKRKEGAFVVAQAAIFVGVIALVALPVQSASQQQVSTAQASETAKGSALGLDRLLLTASLNATQLTVGQTLQVNVSLFNTLPRTNNVTVYRGNPHALSNLTSSQIWPFQGVWLALWPSPLLTSVSTNVNIYPSELAQAVVLKGFYTAANMSSVGDSQFALLGGTVNTWVSNALFEPSSDQANFTGFGIYGEGIGPYHVANSFDTNGYWDLKNITTVSHQGSIFLAYGGQQTGDNPTATPFTPGVYTVGIEDIWGQTVILHFTVR